MSTPDEIVWSHHGTSDLDPTPVDDLEAWMHSYDPRAAAALDRRLDEVFGPISIDVVRQGQVGPGKGGLDVVRHGQAMSGMARSGMAGSGEAGVPTKSGSAEAEPPTTGSIA